MPHEFWASLHGSATPPIAPVASVSVILFLCAHEYLLALWGNYSALRTQALAEKGLRAGKAVSDGASDGKPTPSSVLALVAAFLDRVRDSQQRKFQFLLLLAGETPAHARVWY